MATLSGKKRLAQFISANSDKDGHYKQSALLAMQLRTEESFVLPDALYAGKLIDESIVLPLFSKLKDKLTSREAFACLTTLRVTTAQQVENAALHIITHTQFRDLVVFAGRYKFDFNLLSNDMLHIFINAILDAEGNRVNYSWLSPLQQLLLNRQTALLEEKIAINDIKPINGDKFRLKAEDEFFLEDEEIPYDESEEEDMIQAIYNPPKSLTRSLRSKQKSPTYTVIGVSGTPVVSTNTAATTVTVTSTAERHRREGLTFIEKYPLTIPEAFNT